MANEWSKVELYGANNDGQQRRYTCASGVAITKGALLTLTDPRTAVSHTTGVGDYCAGVAAAAKSATDLSTSISAWTQGVFDAVASGAITAGHPVKSSNVANTIEAAAESIMGAAILGTALETAEDAETINVRLNL